MITHSYISTNVIETEISKRYYHAIEKILATRFRYATQQRESGQKPWLFRLLFNASKKNFLKNFKKKTFS